MIDLRKCSVCIALVIVLVGCGTDYEHPPIIKNKVMPDLPDIQIKLAFTCAYEKDRIPPRDPEADQIFKHARWLEKGNRLKEDPMLFPKIERLIRIATAYGHDKANLELEYVFVPMDKESFESNY